jgi:hypothetical protein
MATARGGVRPAPPPRRTLRVGSWKVRCKCTRDVHSSVLLVRFESRCAARRSGANGHVGAQCKLCEFDNAPSSANCTVCTSARPDAAAPVVEPAKRAPVSQAGPSPAVVDRRPSTATWACSNCFHLNEPASTRCLACHAPRESAAIASAPAPVSAPARERRSVVHSRRRGCRAVLTPSVRQGLGPGRGGGHARAAPAADLVMQLVSAAKSGYRHTLLQVRQQEPPERSRGALGCE